MGRGLGNRTQLKRRCQQTLLFPQPPNAHEMTKESNQYHIARRVGHQGARCTVGNQAVNEKLAPGRRRKNLQLRNTLKIGTWNVRKMKERGKLNTVCAEIQRYDLQILGIAETNWNVSERTHT